MGQTPPRDPIPAPKPGLPPNNQQKWDVSDTPKINQYLDAKFDSPPTPDDRARFDNFAMPSCRCDAEAAQDFAQLELTRLRMVKAERREAAERARKWCFIFAIPAAFFAGNVPALLMMRAAGFGAGIFWGAIVGSFLGIMAVGAFVAWLTAEAIAARISKVAGGLWG